ncbi:amidohydrolase family protein [Paracoccus sulfuroxidans]|uniref:Cytosine deaminase n=1 Tax=Paracoccus sulfuroxidans TaxID=384678 RepID=A0A562NXL1_9RHOB|nr:amidohydrolase family protein [Paracoccus sulfuroxidans]TWI36934.1 cytosine deaminase [Paracoccus sulfuroxidans]
MAMRDLGETTLTGLTLAGRPGRWQMQIAAGRIAALRPCTKAGGGLVLPLLADVHTHLDKTFTAARMPRRAGSLFDAIEMMGADAAGWTVDDLRARTQRGLARAYHHGTALMRSHVDWGEAQPPLAWSVLNELRQDWRGRIELQLASLTALDLMPQIGPGIAAHLRESGGVLGAFIYRNANLARDLATTFDLAEKHGLDLDFHVDEGLDPEAQGFDAIVEETRRRGMAGHVLCGHACSLSVRDPSEVAGLLDRATDAGIGLTVLPGANSYLQDGAPGRTPRLRGLAPLIEAGAAGVPVMIGSDNVRDGFYPYGDYDLFDIFRLAVILGHLPPEDWLDAVSQRPAAWMGHSLQLAEGGPASFIWLDATDLPDAISRPRTARHVWREGRILPETQGETE